MVGEGLKRRIENETTRLLQVHITPDSILGKYASNNDLIHVTWKKSTDLHVSVTHVLYQPTYLLDAEEQGQIEFVSAELININEDIQLNDSATYQKIEGNIYDELTITDHFLEKLTKSGRNYMEFDTYLSKQTNKKTTANGQ